MRCAMPNGDIAIIGMSCQFPGANSIAEFWASLQSSTAISSQEGGQFRPGVKPVNLVADIEKFDPEFFNITPLEATYMSPEQRMLLQNTWHALENANISMSQLSSFKTGVFIGASPSNYQQIISEQATINAYYSSGSTTSTASGRIAYVFDCQGPCLTIDTACSASLHAVHQGCQSIQQNECDIAIVGGVNAILAPNENICFTAAKMLSPDGKCKSFDETADGYVRAEGCGIVILKRLSTAINNNDNIVAVIKGSAINHDGASAGLTVPKGTAQAQVIQAALNNAKLDAAAISYVEAHGTGTALGDPIEINALKNAYKTTEREQPLFVGSVKTNIGHLEAAAGIAGLIKLALSLKHQTLPAHVNCRKPSERIAWHRHNIKLSLATMPWLSSTGLIGAVSAFSFSGSNAHAILAHHESVKKRREKSTFPVLITLSAKSPHALADLCAAYRAEFTDESTAALIAMNASVYRSHFKHRLAFVANDCMQIQTGLDVSNVTPNSKTQKISFFFDQQILPIDYLSLKKMAEQIWPIAEALTQLEQLLLDEKNLILENCDDNILMTKIYNLCLMHLFRVNDIIFDEIIADENSPEIAYFLNEISLMQALKATVKNKQIQTRHFIELQITNIFLGDMQQHVLAVLQQLYQSRQLNHFDNVYYQPKKVQLPNYPFQKQSYWVKSNKTNKSADAKFYQRSIAIDNHAIWHDHVINNELVFPAAAFIEIAIAAVISKTNAKQVALSDLHVKHMLKLQPKKHTLVQVLLKDTDYEIHFVINSYGDNGWLRHCNGSVKKLNATMPIARFPQQTHDNSILSSPAEVEQFYLDSKSIGLNYGPVFQRVQSIWRDENCVIGKIKSIEVGDYSIHPAMLDACFQVAKYVLPQHLRNNIFIPIGCEALVYYSAIESSVICVCQLDCTADISEQKNNFYVNIELVNGHGQVHVSITRLLLQNISQTIYPAQMTIPNIIKSIANFNDDHKLDIEQSLADIGFDSLMYLQLCDKLNSEWDLALSILDLSAMQTISELIDCVAEELTCDAITE